jgi:uncharacterized protein YceK
LKQVIQKKRVFYKSAARISRSIGLMLLLIFINGCSTVSVHIQNPNMVHPYVGTKVAIKRFFNSFVDYDYYGEQFLYGMDIPLCLVTDTVLLPYDLIVTLKK